MSWSTRAPKTKRDRKALLARCGRRAFLDPDRLKFPVMAKSGSCKIDCEGVRAARRRAAQYHYRKVGKRAKGMANRCER